MLMEYAGLKSIACKNAIYQYSLIKKEWPVALYAEVRRGSLKFLFTDSTVWNAAGGQRSFSRRLIPL